MPIIGTLGAASAKGFGFTALSGGAVNWVNSFTDTFTMPSGIALDSQQNIFTTGRTSLEGSKNITLTSYSKGGTALWQRILYSTFSFEYPRARAGAQSVKVDSSGNVYVVGTQMNNNNFERIVVVKYNSSGTLQWQRRLDPGGGPSTSGAQGIAIAIDSLGDIYICGRSYNSSTSKAESLLVKLNSSGVIQFSRFLTENLSVILNGIVLDSSNNIYVCGELNPFNNANIVVFKYNSSGTLQWQRELTGSGNEKAYGIALDSSNNIYVSSMVGSQSKATIFKLNNSGVLQWQRRLTTANYFLEEATIAIDSSDSVYFVCTHVSSSNVFSLELVKYNTSGTVQYKRKVQATLSDGYRVLGGTITVDNLGNMCLFPPTLNNNTDRAMVLKLPTDGSKTGTYTVGGFSFEYAVSTISESAGDLTEAAGSLTSGTSSLANTAASFIDQAGTSTFAFSAI